MQPVYYHETGEFFDPTRLTHGRYVTYWKGVNLWLLDLAGTYLRRGGPIGFDACQNKRKTGSRLWKPKGFWPPVRSVRKK